MKRAQARTSAAGSPSGRLDNANVQLGIELFVIKNSLDIYRVIGRNVKAIKAGEVFFAHAQNQSLGAVALGLARVFEREDAYELCSIRGVYRLAKQVPVRDTRAVGSLVGKYGIDTSQDWVRDLDLVFSRQQPRIQSYLKKIRTSRNTRLAHIQQNAPSGILPSIAAFEDMLGFAVDFHSFVNEAFLSTHSHPILHDRWVEQSLLHLLEKIGVNNPVSGFDVVTTARG